jgi:hypothetical protein
MALTWKSPLYLLTHFANSYFGSQSMSWAKTVLPSCIMRPSPRWSREKVAGNDLKNEIEKTHDIDFNQFLQG